jgi:hypothetical protein
MHCYYYIDDTMHMQRDRLRIHPLDYFDIIGQYH